MCRAFFSLCLCFLLPFCAAAADAGIEHDLRLVLDPAHGRLTARDRLTVPVAASAFLELKMAPQVEIGSVKAGGNPVPWKWAQGVLHIGPLSRSASALTLEIRYGGRFADPVPTAPLNTEDPSYGVAATITPAGTFLAGGSGWYPDLPGQSATFRVRVDAPPGVWGVTAGRLVERGTTETGNFIVWQTEHPLPALTLAAGPYRIAEDRAGPIPIYTFFTAAHADLAKVYLQSVAADLALYQRAVRPLSLRQVRRGGEFLPDRLRFSLLDPARKQHCPPPLYRHDQPRP